MVVKDMVPIRMNRVYIQPVRETSCQLGYRIKIPSKKLKQKPKNSTRDFDCQSPAKLLKNAR